MFRIYKNFHLLSPPIERAGKSNWHCPTCALILIIAIFSSCLIGCGDIQNKAVKNYPDIVNVPEGGTVQGQIVHKGIFITENELNRQMRRKIEQVKKKLELIRAIREENKNRLWQSKTN